MGTIEIKEHRHAPDRDRTPLLQDGALPARRHKARGPRIEGRPVHVFSHWAEDGELDDSDRVLMAGEAVFTVAEY